MRRLIMAVHYEEGPVNKAVALQMKWGLQGNADLSFTLETYALKEILADKHFNLP